MTNFISIFPLDIVIYPGEIVPLHIFEPRYKQLIREYFDENVKPFGIPAVLNNELQEFGTLVEVMEIVQEYGNGDMDIKIKGVEVFRILEVIKHVPNKLYGGAIVNYPENIEDEGRSELMASLLKSTKQVHELLNISKEFKKPDRELRSYDIAHHVGLSIGEEYELLGLFVELQRQEFLKRHLQKVLSVLAEMEQLKEKVKLNGHFRNFSPLNLNIDYPDAPKL